MGEDSKRHITPEQLKQESRQQATMTETDTEEKGGHRIQEGRWWEEAAGEISG